MSPENFNQQVIKQFRSRNGQVGMGFEGTTLLLLHTVGMKSGAQRVNPLVYMQDGDARVVIASAGGATQHPAWFTNLMAARVAAIEVTGSEGVVVERVHARVAVGAERLRLWERQVQLNAAVIDHQRAAGRELPFVILERRQPAD
jgi:deazaflavin-dependent oxidoreductase (nitroreductase family)